MAWLMLAGALACFAMAVGLPVPTPVVLLLLLAALALLVLGTARLLSARLAAATRPDAQMMDAAEMQRLREQIAARRAAEPQGEDDEAPRPPTAH